MCFDGHILQNPTLLLADFAASAVDSVALALHSQQELAVKDSLGSVVAVLAGLRSF